MKNLNLILLHFTSLWIMVRYNIKQMIWFLEIFRSIETNGIEIEVDDLISSIECCVQTSAMLKKQSLSTIFQNISKMNKALIF